MRINVIPVAGLSDLHLRAEYREILMSAHYYNKSANSKKGIDRASIPKQYTLNKGHAKFFYDKFGYVIKRYDELEAEMLERGFKIRDEYSLRKDFVPEFEWNDYKVSDLDMQKNVARILFRIKDAYDNDKGHLYKYLGASVSLEGWYEFYKKLVGEIPAEIWAEVNSEYNKGV